MPNVSRRSVVAGITAGAVHPLLGCARDDWTAFERTSLSIATGNAGGVFVPYGEGIADVLNAHLRGVTVRAERTGASFENLNRLASGEVDLGFTLSDAAADVTESLRTRGEPVGIAALARLYESYVQVVVAGDSSIERLRDLRGKRVSIGVDGSGTQGLALRLFGITGLDESDLTMLRWGLMRSAAALGEGGIDALIFVSGLPNLAISSIADRRGIRLVDLTEPAALMADRYPGAYVSAPVPVGTYGARDALTTVSMTNFLAVRRALPERLAYAVVRVLFERQQALVESHPEVRRLNVGTAILTEPLDLHPGAERYYREIRR